MSSRRPPAGGKIRTAAGASGDLGRVAGPSWCRGNDRYPADAALKLTDRRGDFTILDLSRALKVTPAAIYHHVDGRDAIVTLLRQKMARTVDASAFGQLPWDQALRRWAVSYRETFAAHPGTIGMLAAEPVADPAVHAQYERAVTALEDAGFPGTRSSP